MRFLSAWFCGVSSVWAYIAWLDGSTAALYIALVLVVVTFGQAMWKEAATQRITEKAVKELYDALQDKNSEEYKAFMRGMDKGMQEK